MALQISNFSQPDSSELLDVSESVFGQDYNETLVHQLIVKYQANARAGTKAQKTRSDVSGGGIKPWRQKGTGRARSGSSRSPIWRTGGVTFAARPRSYDQKLNKKMFKAGLRSILSELLRQERLLINDAILPTQPKTKELSTKLKAFNAKKLLIIVDKVDENLALSSRNIPNLKVVEAGNLNPVLLVGAEKIIMTSLALKIIEEHLS